MSGLDWVCFVASWFSSSGGMVLICIGSFVAVCFDWLVISRGLVLSAAIASFLLFGIVPLSSALFFPQIVSCCFLFSLSGCFSRDISVCVRLCSVCCPCSPSFSLSSLSVFLSVVVVVGWRQVLAFFVLLWSAFSQLSALLLFALADSLILSTFLVVLLRPALVPAVLVLAVSSSACLLAVVLLLLFFAVLAVVVPVVGFVLVFVLLLRALVSAVPSSSLIFCLSAWCALLLDSCMDISSAVA